ncbi:MAG: hypothetical protein J2P36_32075, partial [Ktedonobacteraceae bacterium]|nr:hypothetical protein [Ktedonobacteraceae bacterium]
MGNGAIFQLVPQCFRKGLGVATGIIGAAGGLGGFFLPTLLGSIKQFTGSFASGLFLLALIALAALVILRLLMIFQEGWRLSWSLPVPGSQPTAS